jgi:hypothetical protein
MQGDNIEMKIHELGQGCKSESKLSNLLLKSASLKKLSCNDILK